jgi:hypothetical protein
MRFLFLLLSLTTAFSSAAQLSVNYDGKRFGPSEVCEAQLGNDGQSLAFIVSEIDTDVMNIPDEGLPELYQLLIDVNLIEELPFPITPALGNQVSVSLTGIQAGIEENEHLRAQMAATEGEQQAAAAAYGSIDGRSIEERAREIAEKMQSGELSYEEGSKQIEALSQSALQQVEAVELPEIKEMPERSTFEVVCFDTRLKTQSTVISGTLRIIEFTENRFVAELSGRQMVECLEVRSASSPEQSAECNQTASSLLPDVNVLSEGPVSMRVNVALKGFEDHR